LRFGRHFGNAPSYASLDHGRSGSGLGARRNY
jgi:hypothetical protein